MEILPVHQTPHLTPINIPMKNSSALVKSWPRVTTEDRIVPRKLDAVLNVM